MFYADYEIRMNILLSNARVQETFHWLEMHGKRKRIRTLDFMFDVYLESSYDYLLS